MTVSPTALLRSLAQRLHNAGLALWDPTGAYPRNPSRPVITIGKLPQNIVSAVALNHYFTDPEIGLEGQPLHLVQLLFREPGPTPTAVVDRERTANKVLHTTSSGIWPGGVSPLSVTFASAAPAESEDDAWLVAANYEIRLNPGGTPS
ncbi:hypothetical protein [Gordonia sp. NB41Y]|uniref:hypothetical protein n=1 Tax=Gordonia sp. NB41Y TaxID=875808 RepID=UPI0002BE8461|nr:hypothetical protein [Gordonia sp. NB41Y]WLP90256.1 hypothetical protein Q9K23_22525 [Gordonia sp. NB41Y]